MAQISDYLDWRGDVTMDFSPFNEVDNFIISKIGTPDFTGIIPSNSRAVTLTDAVNKYKAMYGDNGKYLGALASPNIGETIFRLPDVERFKNLRLSGFVKKISEAETEQFSALTIGLPDGRFYVSFRGTDDTVLAWKENFMMSVEESVAAQRDALEYLEWVAAQYNGRLIVGGHSKGGNLAVFAAASASKEIQDRITDVYNNDGPGLHSEFYESENYKRISGRIHTILPEHSLVGTLLTQDANAVIVKDSSHGIGAHDGFTWKVMRNEFIRAPKGLSRSSCSFDESMNKMMATMSVEERKAVIDEIFEIIGSTGSSTITDIVERRWHQAKTMAKTFKKSPETKKFVTTIVELMLKDYSVRLQNDVIKK